MKRLTLAQQALAEESLRFVQPEIATFILRNPDLRVTALRCDLKSIAMVAVCAAAKTYDPERSRPTTYFGSAIRHALYRAVLAQRRLDERYVSVGAIRDAMPQRVRSRQEMRATKAVALLSAYDRTLLEDRLIEKITLEQLGAEQNLDPRTIARRVSEAIEKLRDAESNLP